MAEKDINNLSYDEIRKILLFLKAQNVFIGYSIRDIKEFTNDELKKHLKIITENRSNLWSFVVYPNDSLPKDYLSIIHSWHIPTLLSPIHDKDLNADYTEKKKHIHILLYFGNGQNKSFFQILNYSKQLNGTYPIIVNNANAMIRYFIHKDNPEKNQYSINNLISLHGFEYLKAFDNYTNDELLYDKIESIIEENLFINCAILRKYLKEHNFTEELSFFRRHTIYFKSLMDGNYQNLKNGVFIDNSYKNM